MNDGPIPSGRGGLARATLLALGILSGAPRIQAEESPPPPAHPPTFVRVSPRDTRYFELTDGTPYVPIGFNLVGPPDSNDVERVVATMADHGVNYCRIWLDQPPWAIEHARSGEYDPERAKQLDRFLALCRPRGIRVKMCIEWFRSIAADPPKPPTKGSFPKPLHHVANGGFYQDMKDFLTSERGRAQFKGKLRWHADRYGDEPAVFAWELWNEMNAVQGEWHPWTQEMLPELHRLFPRNLAVQSLGSFDRARARDGYRLLCEIPDNDVLQVHRYIDLGAELPVCHGPADILAADAVAELRAFGIRKPIILTETGFVKPKHTGASECYEKDKHGMLLHDMLFAPFFAGAAGTGHVWFWRQAIDTPNHWHHFRRFRRAIEATDPPAEGFEPIQIDHPQLRIYALRGKRTVLAWCRDSQNDWRSELEQGVAPRTLSNVRIPIGDLAPTASAAPANIDAYDPWEDRWAPARREGADVVLPDLRRSLILRCRP